MPQHIKTHDVIIIGAGPAGSTCALALRNAGLKVAMIDKANFPRDKICGDAIPGRAVKTLNGIDPAFAQRFRKFPQKNLTKTSTVFYKGDALTFNWVLDAYTCTRMAFDNFLMDLVRENTGTEICTGVKTGNLTAHEGLVSVEVNGDCMHAPLVIGADGAHSVVARQLTSRTVDRRHYVGSVRAYYSGVTGMTDDNIEVYFDRQYLPSYLWVFPLPNGIVNVGFGMLSSEIARRRMNIKTAFYDFIDTTPLLKEKFATATRVSDLEGFGLPLGSKIGSISGNRFMLTGDAASLIDPISGDGIGNAMLSGKLAAEQAIRCFQINDFSAQFMRGYDQAIKNALGGELKKRYQTQRILSKMPFLLDVLFAAGKNRTLKKIIQKGL